MVEKSAYPHLAPQQPQQQQTNYDAAGSSGQIQMPPAPPSYDQAMGQNYNSPPVQVLPTPREQNFNRPSPTPASVFVGPTVTGNSAPRPNYGANTHFHNPPQQQATMPPTIMQQPVVIIQQPTLLPLGPEPAYITCPNCHVQKLTRIDYEPSARTHLMAALLCVLGLWCCVCLPYCAGSCMNTNHYCGNCNKFLGTYGSAL